MIEVPAAALAADSLAAEADSSRSAPTDLIQYTLAIDRTDETVAHMYNPLHPAVLRLVQFAVEAAARRGIPISICGEIAGDPRYAALLLGLGLRELSMAPRNIPRVKQRIRNLDMVAASRRARAIMGPIRFGTDRACSTISTPWPRPGDIEPLPRVDDIKISLYVEGLPAAALNSREPLDA